MIVNFGMFGSIEWTRNLIRATFRVYAHFFLTYEHVLLVEKYVRMSSVKNCWSKYRVIQNDCRGSNNLSYTTHL